MVDRSAYDASTLNRPHAVPPSDSLDMDGRTDGAGGALDSVTSESSESLVVGSAVCRVEMTFTVSASSM